MFCACLGSEFFLSREVLKWSPLPHGLSGKSFSVHERLAMGNGRWLRVSKFRRHRLLRHLKQHLFDNQTRPAGLETGWGRFI